MGDSITFGWPNAEILHYPAYLEFILNSSFMNTKLPTTKRYVDVINAGIPAYTSPLVIRYLKDSIIKLHPDMVIISIGYNDMGHQSNSVLWFLQKNIPIFHWYYNMSATFSFLRKTLSPVTSKIKQISLERSNKSEHSLKNVLEKNSEYLEYEENMREIVKILKKRNILPVLVPWPKTSDSGNVKKFVFDNNESIDEYSMLQYREYILAMEKVSKEFSIPFIRTPFQLPIIPRKHNAKYFMTSGVHLNNYGAKVVGLSLANAINGIFEGKNNKEIYQESFASKSDADLLDLYTYILLNVEPAGKTALQKLIQFIEDSIANNCLNYTEEDMSLPNFHFSECFFAIPDTALYQMRQGNYQSAKRYLEYATSRYPKLAYPYFIYGLYHIELGNYDEAILFFEKAIEVAPFFKTPQQYINQLQKNF
jgi:lysophospholipase L1-like esterase